MEIRRSGRRGIALAAALLMAVLALRGVQAGNKSAPGPVLDAAGDGVRASENCQVIQTMGFSRCGHSVTRRVRIPQELAGADFQGVQAHYSVWRIEEFAADKIEMTREIPLFCPAHRVLSVSEAGEIVLTWNAYGDGMAVEKTYEDRSVGDFSPEEQETLLSGMGFDTREDAEAWLLAH
ncbi:MAG: hypothetical protein K5919_04760 [Clostridiales bacterium]|nr:hypothetical protein [Clostridiales bacterium]